nr:hypothetical protein [Nonomuraea terrae]
MLSATYEVIAWNDLAAALMVDFSALPPRDRNLIRYAFLGSRLEESGLPALAEADRSVFAHETARRLRAAAARYPGACEVAGLVSELLVGSAEFVRLRASHDVRAEPAMRKTVNHPLIGPITPRLRRPRHHRPRPAGRHLHRRSRLSVGGGAAAAVDDRHAAHGRARLSRAGWRLSAAFGLRGGRRRPRVSAVRSCRGPTRLPDRRGPSARRRLWTA